MDSSENKKEPGKRRIEEYIIFIIIAVTAAGIHLISCGSMFTRKNECRSNCRRINAECISDCRRTFDTSTVSDEFRRRNSGFRYLRETSMNKCSDACSRNYQGCLERCSEDLVRHKGTH